MFTTSTWIFLYSKRPKMYALNFGKKFECLSNRISTSSLVATGRLAKDCPLSGCVRRAVTSGKVYWVMKRQSVKRAAHGASVPEQYKCNIAILQTLIRLVHILSSRCPHSGLDIWPEFTNKRRNCISRSKKCEKYPISRWETSCTDLFGVK